VDNSVVLLARAGKIELGQADRYPSWRWNSSVPRLHSASMGCQMSRNGIMTGVIRMNEPIMGAIVLR
jgi:hypothetical protein